MLIGYVRVSTQEQNAARQDALMRELGIERLFSDVATGSNSARSGLSEMLAFVRAGDTVVVESISRIARNTRDLLQIIDKLIEKHVAFISQKEAIDTTTPTGKFMLTVFGAVAELERDYLLQRQREGITQAKMQGKYKGRKPISVDKTLWTSVYNKWQCGEITAVQAQKKLNLSPSTFYRHVKKISALSDSSSET